MQYLTTRQGLTASASRAILKGLGDDGGLFVPESLPEVSRKALEELAACPYNARAERLLGPFFPQIPPDALKEMIRSAYSRFDENGVAPVKSLDGGVYVMELWHGPTLAFKDVALTLLPHLMRASVAAEGEDKCVLILVATSGDTGKAALSGFMDVEGTKCAVFYPRDGVSPAQRLQMVTQRGGNTYVIAVEGNFDDAQTGVKEIFLSDRARESFFQKNIVLSSANSINWGRLAPQIVYYFSAYCDLLSDGRLACGDEINICVPTGNFGNILAAYYAMRMGLPVGRLIVGSNKNNVLTDFVNTGVYDARRPFHVTTSPSMDILISSNLERLLFEVTNRDGEKVSSWMRELKQNGVYRIDQRALDAIQSVFSAAWADDSDAASQIAGLWRDQGYLVDPHTAVAVKALNDYRAASGDNRPCVLASTASPFKFARAVGAAIGLDVTGGETEVCARLADKAGLRVPDAIAELETLPIRHRTSCKPEDMLAALIERIDR